MPCHACQAVKRIKIVETSRDCKTRCWLVTVQRQPRRSTTGRYSRKHSSPLAK